MQKDQMPTNVNQDMTSEDHQVLENALRSTHSIFDDADSEFNTMVANNYRPESDEPEEEERKDV